MTGGKRKIKPIWGVALASGLVFFFLLGVRLDLFTEKTVLTSVDARKLSGNESWMNIYQQDRKIGYSHRRFMPKDDGYEFIDTTYLRINTMGMTQDLHMRTNAALKSNLTLDNFEFTLRSNLFDFKASGESQNGILTVRVGDQKAEIPMEDGLYLTGGVLDAAWESRLKPGETRTFSVFDPATLGRRPVKITAEEEEYITVMGKRQKTTRLSVDFMGAKQTAWIGEDGKVLQERGLMGITMKRVTQNEAFDELAVSPSSDLTQTVSVAANMTLEQPMALSRLRLEISGIGDTLFLDGGRQSLEEGVLTINKETVSEFHTISADDFSRFTGPTPFIESDHPDIVELVGRIVKPEDPPLEKVKKITGWIYENIEKRPVISVPSALQTLKSKMGDCNEHAVLLAAMARAAGIPAQIEAGLVYMRGRFFYHAWNVLHLDRWVTVDSLMNQIPADVTHIRFVRGEPREQVDLMGVIGTVGLKILDKS